jgi:hypothetical protein
MSTTIVGKGPADDGYKPVLAPGKRRHLPPGVPTAVDLERPWLAEDEILEEFDFDHELTWKFHAGLEKCDILVTFVPSLLVLAIGVLLCVLVSLWFLFLALPALLASFRIFAYGFADANAADGAYCRWVAVSRDNVYIIRKKRQSGCRCSCQDIGETRKLIPIANIQDVMITEPAGTACLCFIDNVLTYVQIQTAASGGAVEPHLDASQGYLAGLQDPNRFRDVVMGLKKGRYVAKTGDASAFTPAADSLSGVIQTIEVSPNSPSASPAMLNELRGIRQLLSQDMELRKTEVELMRSMDEKLSLLPKALNAV